MVCQYSTRGLVSSGKHKAPSEAGVEGRGCERLTQDLKDMAAALGPFMQEAHAMTGQRHPARHGEVPATEQPRIRNGVMRGTTRKG
jgi:hypothetical protein